MTGVPVRTDEEVSSALAKLKTELPKVVFISDPMNDDGSTAQISANAYDALAFVMRLAEYGVGSYCAQLTVLAVLNRDLDVPPEMIRQTSLAMLPHCDAVLMMPGWEKAEGSRIEHQEAVDLGMTIFYPKSDSLNHIESIGAWAGTV